MMKLRINKYSIALLIIIVSCNSRDNKISITDKNMSNTINIGAIVTYKKVIKIDRNDIIVFNSPSTNRPTCLRVIGFPGDKIEIIKGEILINNMPYNRNSSTTTVYTVFSKTPNRFYNLSKYNFKPYSDNYGIVRITEKQLQEIVEGKLVDSVYQLGFDSLYVYPNILKITTSKHFNHYYFGPIFLPKIGDTILKKDKMLIEGFSNFDTDSFIIDEDYYFCIGDSFSDAMDSRIIGLIPKSKILGKVNYIKNTTVVNIETQNDSL